MMINIDVTLDTYFDTDGNIVSDMWLDGDEPIHTEKMSLEECLNKMIERNVVPSNPPTITRSDRDRLEVTISNLRNQIDAAEAYLYNIEPYQVQGPDSRKPVASSVVEVYRYIRRPSHALHSNLGGITFLFQFENYGVEGEKPASKLRFAYSICNSKENFNADIGRSIAMGRMDDGKFIEIDYDRGISLVENVVLYFSGKFNNNIISTEEKKVYFSILSNCMNERY